jgi:hypothetical protein
MGMYDPTNTTMFGYLILARNLRWGDCRWRGPRVGRCNVMKELRFWLLLILVIEVSVRKELWLCIGINGVTGNNCWLGDSY